MGSIGTCEHSWRNRNQKTRGRREDKEVKSVEVSQGPMGSGDWQNYWIHKTHELGTLSVHQVNRRPPAHADITSGPCPLVCTQEASGCLTWTETTGPHIHLMRKRAHRGDPPRAAQKLVVLPCDPPPPRAWLGSPSDHISHRCPWGCACGGWKPSAANGSTSMAEEDSKKHWLWSIPPPCKGEGDIQ